MGWSAVCAKVSWIWLLEEWMRLSRARGGDGGFMTKLVVS